MAFSTFNSLHQSLMMINQIINKYIFAVDASLVLYYPFDSKDITNSTPNYASTLPIYDGTMYGTSQITTTTNNYITSLADLSLNNTAGSTATNYVITTNTFQTVPTNGLSISCFFSCSGQLSTNQSVFSLSTSGVANGINISISGTNNILSGYYSDVTPVTTNTYTYVTGFKQGQFNHAVLSISGTVHTLYLDGVQVIQNTNAGNIFATYSTITNTTIGCLTDKTQAFRGFIGDFKVYNRAITSTEVSNLYLNRNLVISYPFDVSVNNLTPNNALLAYDASFVGTVGITTNSLIGTGALSLTNTAGANATSYIASSLGTSIPLNSSTGLTISCWVNTLSLTNNSIMCLFDIPSATGTKGLSVDICGNNYIYSTAF